MNRKSVTISSRLVPGMSISRGGSESTFDASILIVVQDQRQALTDCLVLLAQLTTRPSYDLVIVDDGSSDGTAELFASLGGDVQTVRHEQPKGRAACLNFAAREGRGRYLVVLDPLIAPAYGWLAALVGFADQHLHLAAFGLQIVDDTGADVALGVGYASAELTSAAITPREQGRLKRRDLPALGHGCLLVRASAFRTVEGFDERFRSRGADLDLCLRLHARGLGVGLSPGCLQTRASSQFDAERDNADLALLRRRWGVPPSAGENAIWAEDVSPEAKFVAALGGLAGQRGGDAPSANLAFGPVGHFPNDPARRLPPWVDVGTRTYFAGSTVFRVWTSEERIRIGSYCSFADNVTLFAGGGHSIDTASSFPFEALIFGAPNPTRSYRSSRDTVIGSDVWIGTHVIIAGGVQIGDGAVIATGSVVLTDVPPYAVVAGNPASVLRRRFSRTVVDALLRIAWWNWPEKLVLQRLEWFFRPIAEFVAEFDPRKGETHATAGIAAGEGVGDQGKD
jgi:acetyltransferase-like isoleucine patch superfamily enzyme/GT2 family glycosyltransferase